MWKQTLFKIDLKPKFTNDLGFVQGDIHLAVWAGSKAEAITVMEWAIGGGAIQKLYTIDATPVTTFGTEVSRVLDDSIKPELVPITVSQESLYCLAMHFKAFYEQACADQPADFGTPCAHCRKLTQCRGLWAERILPICSAVDVPINLHSFYEMAHRKQGKE